jgi:uncharacterized RDD family membrane protein YckC
MSGAGAFDAGSQGGWQQPAGASPGALAHPAGWWARVGAAIIDGLIILACAVVLGLLGAIAGEDTAYGLAGIGYFAATIFYAPTLLVTNGGQTWGKQATGVRVINADARPIGFGRAFCREVLIKTLLFGIIPLVGLVNVLWPLWQDEHKALHDLMAGTRVIDA